MALIIMIKYKNFYFFKSNKNKTFCLVIKPTKVTIKYLNLEEIIQRSQIKLPWRLP